MHRAFQILKPLLSILVVAWAVATITFVLMRAIPGGPLSKERNVPAAVRAAIEAKYHLDLPWYSQYYYYLADAATGRFGLSYDDPGRTVGEIIAQRFPVSALLGSLAILLALSLAFPLGVAGALRQGHWPDRLNGFVAAAGVSIPSFILAALLLVVFSFQLRWFPSSGWRGPAWAVLPTIALAAFPTAYMTRLIRSELSEVLRSEFLMTARAKGLSFPRVVIKHALPHTLAAVLAFLGPEVAAVMTGSFVVERVFNIPGLGQYFVTSIANRNYPLIMGVTLVYTVLLVAMNLLAESASTLIDPRRRKRS